MMVEFTMHSAAGMAKTRDLATEITIEDLVREHSTLVFRICYAVSRNHHDAEDATQEVFLRAHKSRTKLAHVEDAKSWLARIAWRVAIDRLPKRNDLSISDEDASLMLAGLRASGISAEEAAAHSQANRLLTRMVMTLPDDLRAPLLLGSIQELNSRQIADALGIPESTVRVRQMRARQLIKEKLSNHFGGGR